MEQQVADHKLRNIYTIRYKKTGQIYEQPIHAENISGAREAAKKYLAYLAGRDNAKVQLIGEVRSFAIDVDRWIENDKKKPV